MIMLFEREYARDEHDFLLSLGYKPVKTPLHVSYRHPLHGYTVLQSEKGFHFGSDFEDARESPALQGNEFIQHVNAYHRNR